MSLTPDQAARHADEVRETGVTFLRGLIPADTLDRWNEGFGPLLAGAVLREGDRPNRGPHRYYVTLPFHGLWADPAVIDNDAILAVVERLVGADGVLGELAADTPLLGSEHQDLGRDAQDLFPETGARTPPYQLAVHIPLVDVCDDNGPLEYAPGTHRLSRDEAGAIPLVAAHMVRGDVMIRDARLIHRGAPNRTGTPRPVAVLGYSRAWLHRPQVNIRIPAEVLVSLPARARRWLRFNPVFESRAEAANQDALYRAAAS
jgi:ectoine hydroxylase-related dioxygenase (phytanoyl-CoA dioxygenase family)